MDTKAGVLYNRIAAEYFLNYRNEKLDENFYNILQRNNIDEIETLTHSKRIIATGIRTLRNLLGEKDIHLPADIIQIVFFSQSPSADLAEYGKSITKAPLTEAEKTKIVLCCLEEMHDEWVRTNSQFFFFSDFADRCFMFMPFPLIGLKEAMKYLTFIDPLLKILELRPERCAIEQAYKEYQKHFVRQNKIRSLLRYITDNNYEALNDSIKITLGFYNNICNKIVQQIKAENPNLFR